jgi:Raf kinase inhibitor-like YbhB/YbcL family protein
MRNLRIKKYYFRSRDLTGGAVVLAELTNSGVVLNMLANLIGQLLRGVRAGEYHLAWNHPSARTAAVTLTLTSEQFSVGGLIPFRHAGPGVGENVSPSLSWSTPPTGTKEIVLIIEDQDAPLPRPFVHLVAYAIDPAAGTLPESALAASSQTVCFGRNTFGGVGYDGPRALKGHGPHRYIFEVFAIARTLSFAKPPSRRQLLAEIEGYVLARGRLDGFFERP